MTRNCDRGSVLFIPGPSPARPRSVAVVRIGRDPRDLEQLDGVGAGEGAAIEEGLEVGALDAVADARAELTGLELAGLDPVPNRLLVRADDAGPQ